MAVINITGAWTADASDIWTPAPSFVSDMPFAVVIEVELVANPPYLDDTFSATWIMGTPRQDPYTPSWYTAIDDNGMLMPTVVYEWDFEWDYRHKGKNFAVWDAFDHYSDAVSQVLGGEKDQGVFYLQGIIVARGTGYFAVSDKYWYRVQASGK
jgi:hypothetical protein